MSIEVNITADDEWFLGEDKLLSFHVQDASGVPVDVAAGWTFAWALRRSLGSATALITKTTASGIAVVGAYNVSPTVNTQRVQVTVADTDTDALAEGSYPHALKRTDGGSEAVLAHGTAQLLRAAVP